MPLVVNSRDPCGSSSPSLLGFEFAHQLAIAARRERVESRRGSRYGVPCRERGEEQGDAQQGEKDGTVPTKEALSVPAGRGAAATSGHPTTSTASRSRCFVGAEMRIERIRPPAVVTARGVPRPVIVRSAVPPRSTAHRASSSEVIFGGRLGPRRSRSSSSTSESSSRSTAAAPAEPSSEVSLSAFRVGQEFIRSDDGLEFVIIVGARLALAFGGPAPVCSGRASVRVVQFHEFEIPLLPEPEGGRASPSASVVPL